MIISKKIVATDALVWIHLWMCYIRLWAISWQPHVSYTWNLHYWILSGMHFATSVHSWSKGLNIIAFVPFGQFPFWECHWIPPGIFQAITSLRHARLSDCLIFILEWAFPFSFLVIASSNTLKHNLSMPEHFINKFGCYFFTFAV